MKMTVLMDKLRINAVFLHEKACFCGEVVQYVAFVHKNSRFCGQRRVDV